MAEATLLETAKVALKSNLIPVPEDLLSELDPVTLVFWAEEVMAFVSVAYLESLSDSASADLEPGAGPIVAGEAVVEALGNLTAACLALGIFQVEQ